MTKWLTGILGMILCGAGIWMKKAGTFTYSIIGGGDGPTSVFVAGKIAGREVASVSTGMVILGVALVIVSGILWMKSRRSR